MHFVFWFCLKSMLMTSGLYRLEEVRNSIVEDGHIAIALRADVVNRIEVFNFLLQQNMHLRMAILFKERKQNP